MRGRRITRVCLVVAFACAGLIVLAEDVAPKAETPKAEAPATEKKDAAPATEKKDAAAPLPTFPLKSEFFQHVVDTQMTGDDDEAMRIEVHAMEDILLALQASTDEHLAKNVTPDVTFRKLMKNAEEYRGRVVELTGLLEYVERFPVPENKSGVEALYRGQITKMTGEMYTFFSIQRPADALMKRPVQLTGIFLKRYAFENRLAGEKATWTPAVFCRRIETYVEREEAPGHSPMSQTTALLAAIFLAFVVFRGILEYKRQKAKTARENPFQKGKKGVAGIQPPVKLPRPGSKKP